MILLAIANHGISVLCGHSAKINAEGGSVNGGWIYKIPRRRFTAFLSIHSCNTTPLMAAADPSDDHH